MHHKRKNKNKQNNAFTEAKFINDLHLWGGWQQNATLKNLKHKRIANVSPTKMYYQLTIEGPGFFMHSDEKVNQIGNKMKQAMTITATEAAENNADSPNISAKCSH